MDFRAFEEALRGIENIVARVEHASGNCHTLYIGKTQALLGGYSVVTIPCTKDNVRRTFKVRVKPGTIFGLNTVHRLRGTGQHFRSGEDIRIKFALE